jgi:23S rRNA (adenine2503-C2)-methyltransferase
LQHVNLDQLSTVCAEHGEPAYRAPQIWRWIAQGASAYEEMTDVPIKLRTALARDMPFSTLAPERELGARDGTVKALLRTRDGHPIETVLMRYRDGRHSLCISSQSGCPLTCTFCATGRMRFARNLTTWEILDQALHFRRPRPGVSGRLDHAVFMGMGEPMMNLDNVLRACELLPDLGITHRRTAISTIGWIPGIERLAREPLPIRLALSLHAPDDALRSELMPINDRYPLRDVIAACEAFYGAKHRMVMVEYVMLAGVNDFHQQAQALAGLLDPRMFKVNLIPYNPTGSPYRASGPGAIAAFRAELERQGLRVSVRLERGREIAAACGQLAVAAAGDRPGEADSGHVHGDHSNVAVAPAGSAYWKE